MISTDTDEMGRDVGMRLRHARKLRGLTQVQLAKASGVKQASLSELETGESKSFKGTTLVSLAQTLDVSPEWLQSGKGPMERSPEHNLPLEAVKLAREWMKLTPEVRVRVYEMVREMVKSSAADKTPAHDDRVAEAYGKPGKPKKPPQ